MKKFAPLGFFLLFLALAPGRLAADQLTITAPTGGTFTVGLNMDINWTYQFMEWLPSTAEQRQMIIYAREYSIQGNGPVPGSFAEIATVDVNAQHYSWKVANFYTKWDGFILEIRMKLNGAILAWSPMFQIKRIAMPKAAIAPILVDRTIAVTSPAAGQNCKIGTSVTIAWDKNKIKNYGYVWLEICWPNHTSTAGAFPTSNTGSYVWTIHETAENTLCVKVYTQDNKYSGFSGNFKVVK